MTECEAKKRWCPMMRDFEKLTTGGAMFNYFTKGINNRNCVASDCMMWVEMDRMPRKALAMGRPPKPGDDNGKPIRSGYCGLAR